MYKNINDRNLFENTQFKPTFTFFSPLSADKIASKLSRNLRKKVTFNKNYIKESKKKDKEFYLSPHFTEGYLMYEFKSGMLPYDEALHLTLKTMHIIESIGFTTDVCSMKLDVKSKNINHGFNVIKMIMSIDENKIIEHWYRTGQEKIYQQHIHYIYPTRPFEKEINSRIFETSSNMELNIPESERFGMSFSKIKEGIVSLNYIGGKDYEKSTKDTSKFIGEIVEKINKSANNRNYDSVEQSKINQLTERQKRVLSNIKTYESFCKNYKDIKLFLDLKHNNDDLKQRYNLFREKLFHLIAFGGIKEGLVNYNSDNGKIEIKSARVRQGILIENVDFYNSVITGDLKNCKLFSCDMFASTLTECKLLDGNKIKKSKVFECEFGGNGNEIVSSYVENNKNIVHANIKTSMIRGKISQLSQIDEESLPFLS